jgi:Ca-activated chloride channel family protein
VVEAGRETYLRDGEGREVVTAMDEESLRRIAAETGGAFATTEGAKGALVRIYEDEIRPMARRTFLAEERRERENRYQWPLLLAFLLLMADFLLCEKRP